MIRPFHSRVSRYVRVRRRLVARRSVALSVESLGRSFVLHSVRKAQVAVAALQASAQGEGCSGMNADTAYTVNLIQKGLTRMPLRMPLT